MHNIYNLHNILFYLICFYLLQLQDATGMNADITPVQKDGRQAQRGVQCIMVFVQKTCNLVWKHRQNRILAVLTSISMQYRLPSKRMVPTVVSSSTNQFVCWESSNLCLIPNVDVNACRISAGYYLGWMWVSVVPAIRPERDTFAWPWINNLPIVDFASIFKSYCSQCNVS
jgi:hypothetical protein